MIRQDDSDVESIMLRNHFCHTVAWGCVAPEELPKIAKLLEDIECLSVGCGNATVERVLMTEYRTNFTLTDVSPRQRGGG